MVGEGGLEPPCPREHQVLNLARLPIPPFALDNNTMPGFLSSVSFYFNFFIFKFKNIISYCSSTTLV